MERSLGQDKLLPGLLSLPAVTPPLLGHLGYPLKAGHFHDFTAFAH
jgi:hypothetical protein